MKGWQKILGDIVAWLMVIGGIGYALYGYSPGKTITTTTTTPQVSQVQQDETTVQKNEDVAGTALAAAATAKTTGETSSVKVITNDTEQQKSAQTQQASNNITAETTPKEEMKEDTVTVSVKTPEGYLLAPRKIAIDDQTKAADVLIQACNEAGLKLENTGSGAMLYTKAVGDWREFDKGPYSGWSYRINGVKGDRSSGVKDVNPGDTIEWSYVLDFREDK
jgi:hypothetical protein